MSQPPRFLVAPDKFKGSLSAAEAARAITDGIRRIFPDAAIRVLPLADGGEGTVAAFLDQGAGEWTPVPTVDALGRPIEAGYVKLGNRPGVVLEMASAAGLVQIAVDERDPLVATTAGVGRLVLAARKAGAEEIWIGLGGSATNDGGAGLAHALGWRFLDAEGLEFFPRPLQLIRLETLVPPPASPAFSCVALADVANPLLGPRGATAVFGPQKGVTTATADLLEKGLRRLADVAAATLGRDCRDVPGAGAAGGLGFGLLTFCDARIRQGFDVIAELCGLEEALAACDFVFTGEGRLDAQSLEGKGPVALARLARRLGKPTLALAGHVETGAGLEAEFDFIASMISRPMTLDEAVAEASELLRFAAAGAASLIRATLSPPLSAS